MAGTIEKYEPVDRQELHQYYSSILNCMPYLVYWVDKNCELLGCNQQYSQLLELKNIKDFTGSPYERVAKAARWSDAEAEVYRIEDMSVVFNGQARQSELVPPFKQQDDSLKYYLCNRHPLFNLNAQLIGIVIIMLEVSEAAYQEQRQRIKPNKSLKSSSTVKNHAPRVLIVEDNLVAKQVEEALLLALKCEVDTATSGTQALTLFEPGKYDLVIMDIGLEDTSGYVLSKQFRAMEKNSEFQVPIVALTSFQADLVKHDCDHYAMNGVISKPLTAEQADQIVQHYVYLKEVEVSGLIQV